MNGEQFQGEISDIAKRVMSGIKKKKDNLCPHIEGECTCGGPGFTIVKKEFDAVKDSGERRSFDTGSVRDVRKGKGRFDLIPPEMLSRLAKHFENGAVKYGDRNWEKGQTIMTYLDSAKRHINHVEMGHFDEDHLAAAIWNLTAYLTTLDRIERGILPATLDDRPGYMLGDHHD